MRDAQKTLAEPNLLQGDDGAQIQSRIPVRDKKVFKKWFGDSVVVDEKGEPMVVYHGTDQDFVTFDPDKCGSNTSTDNAFTGFFFIARRELAEQFANETSGGNRIIEAYLSIQQPLRITVPELFTNKDQAPTIHEILSGERLGESEALERLNENIGVAEWCEIGEILSTDDAIAIMKRDGFDGVMSEFGDGHLEYVAFYPEQITSASHSGGAEANDTRHKRTASAAQTRLLTRMEGAPGTIDQSVSEGPSF